jgi:hypothetical protein
LVSMVGDVCNRARESKIEMDSIRIDVKIC